MKKNTTLLVTAMLSALLALSGCGRSSEEPGLTTESVAPAAANASPSVTQAPLSPRGNLIKHVGEPAGNRVAEGSDEWALKFTVTSIDVDPTCTFVHSEPAENGHLVAISIDAVTGPEPGFSDALGYASFGAGSWKAISSNGTTVNSITSFAADNCFDSGEYVRSSIGAAEKVTGKIVLDVPDASGILVYAPYGATGWEWEYGASQQ